MSDYITQLQERWGSAATGQTYEQFLEAEVFRLREAIRNWSYCTDIGMRRECPEKVEELAELLIGLNIAPYSLRRL